MSKRRNQAETNIDTLAGNSMKHIPIIETERLLLKPFELKDSAFIVELMNTEGWIRYIGDRNVRTKKQAEEYLETGPFKSYEENGYGLSRVELKAGGAAIGMCGLIKRDYLDHPDIGFAFLPAYMGKGYAAEITHKIISHAFNKLQHKKILAITLPSNSSSIKLLQKTGFIYEKTIVSRDNNEELLLFGISKAGLRR